ncbi:histidine kinase [uncultured Tenacibaculum sp.]|uniref:histidine kinase n=1 Tax=uncultured Tenacibaculum sp. TaxID=174713 RepID=UPI002613E9B3|nr:histidine kinase [uncultured Tenacibaculum sp.]
MKVKSQGPVLDKGGGFELRVRIFDTENNEYIRNAQVSINAFTTSISDINGYYRLKARINDELVVRHPDFETVRKTIDVKDDITIEVRDNPRYSKRGKTKSSSRKFIKRKAISKDYKQIMDSALYYKEKNLDRSISFIEEALEANESKKRNANTYKVLGDIYFFWKQYDIAISNYKISLQIFDKEETRLQLAKTQFLAKKYEDSEISYKLLENENLSNYDKIQVLEGLGDALAKQNKDKEAKKYFERALKLAKDKSIDNETLDLNTKLANIYAKQGNLREANTITLNTLREASELPKEPALKVQQEVADFYNETRQYDNEIKLRKELLKSVDKAKIKNEVDNLDNKSFSIPTDDKTETNTDSLTSQKLNYKIGNAYVQKENYTEAIEYLEKSVEEAGEKEDLEVQKHATRKLSEVYATVGQHVKAIQTYRNYVDIVDSLYIRKEQEIYQAKRLTKKISDYQSRIKVLERNNELSDSKVSLAIKEEQLTKAKSKTQLIVIYSLVGSLVLMTLLTFYKHRANQKQQLANNLLALKSMRSQMNPHFIFNALNSVNSFIAVNDERNANRYLSEFSALMRSVLENSDEDFIPFTKEIELLELYVKLEHNRFRDKFDYTINVDEGINLDEFKIPPMLLQPYIENAIWHGLRYKKEKGNLTIAIKKKDYNSVTIVIEDDGIGRKRSLEMKTKNQLKQKSKGMSTIKNRIAILNDMYQDKVDVIITDLLEDGSGTKVELTLKK